MNAGNRTYSIKDLENYCGIKAHTIRMWEKRYEILRPERSDSNIRHYTEEELKKLITISILNRNGLKISRIASLSDNELLKEVMKYGSGDEQDDDSFKPGELIMSALRFSEEQFREKLNPFIADKGMRESYIRIFHPLMQKAKALWLTDCLSRPQEQFIRHVIRTLIISEDMKLGSPLITECAAVVNLGDNEAENNLIFLKYLLKMKGFDVVYTEGTLSGDEIKGIHSIRPFTVMAINLPAVEPEAEVKDFCNNINRELRLRKILVTGRYDSNCTWNNGTTEAVSTPAEMAAWADRL
ncbi:MAG: MerR family transcriptional regulator [Bacteroidales bacterium]|jgi:DNA-binding transcriptional MerR regulator|nr:MerR family transcriptional regulator [Bacteroidales bacterium]